MYDTTPDCYKPDKETVNVTSEVREYNFTEALLFANYSIKIKDEWEGISDEAFCITIGTLPIEFQEEEITSSSMTLLTIFKIPDFCGASDVETICFNDSSPKSKLNNNTSKRNSTTYEVNVPNLEPFTNYTCNSLASIGQISTAKIGHHVKKTFQTKEGGEFWVVSHTRKFCDYNLVLRSIEFHRYQAKNVAPTYTKLLTPTNDSVFVICEIILVCIQLF